MRARFNFEGTVIAKSKGWSEEIKAVLGCWCSSSCQLPCQTAHNPLSSFPEQDAGCAPSIFRCLRCCVTPAPRIALCLLISSGIKRERWGLQPLQCVNVKVHVVKTSHVDNKCFCSKVYLFEDILRGSPWDPYWEYLLKLGVDSNAKINEDKG